MSIWLLSDDTTAVLIDETWLQSWRTVNMAVNENTPTGSRGARRITTTALASAAVIALLSGFGAVAFSDAPVPANAKIVGVHMRFDG